MKIFLIFATLIAFSVSLQAATTTITVDSQEYTVTYHTGTDFDTYEDTINNGNAAWWTDNPGNGVTAQAWANAANGDLAISGLRFAYAVPGNVFYYGNTGVGTSSWGQDATDGTGAYAVSAVAVPAPLPILGILPVVGFLKRMRRRQKAS